MRPGERQVAPDISGVRRDHVARYEFVAKRIKRGQRVIDIACGVGYGSQLLAEKGAIVLGVDRDAEAIEYARKHYAHKGACYKQGDASAPADWGKQDVAVCFETIEHVEDPFPLLAALNGYASTLYASVPNEFRLPWNGTAYHYRHYTKDEFGSLLAQAGWAVTEWLGQEGPESEVAPNMDGRTLIAVAKRSGKPRKQEKISAKEAGPAHVAILGLGPTLEQYVDLTKRLGGRNKLCDETWVINGLGNVLACDRVFHMDDVLVQEARAAAKPSSNIAAMLQWMRRFKCEILTSVVDEDGRDRSAYPGLRSYPLADVISSTGHAYFNSTAAYAVAHAIHIAVKKISLFGFDFTYASSHDAEKGRACVEFWLAVASERGIELQIADRSSLMDMCEPRHLKFYGYDAVDIHIAEQRNGPVRTIMTPREKLPTAAEIEARYDHSAHPNSLVRR